MGYLRSVWLVLLSCGVSLLSAEVWADDKALMLGISGYANKPNIIAHHQPLIDYLDSKLDDPVTVEVAPDMPLFYERALAQEFDLVVASAQYAMQLQRLGLYQVVAKSTADLRPALVLSKKRKVNAMSELAGLRVALPDVASLLGVVFKQTIDTGNAGLSQKIQWVHATTYREAVDFVMAGKADAALSVAPMINLLKSEGVDSLYYKQLPMPSLASFFMVKVDHPRLDREELQLLMRNSSQWFWRYKKKNKVPDWRAMYSPVESVDLPALEPYIDRLIELELAPAEME